MFYTAIYDGTNMNHSIILTAFSTPPPPETTSHRHLSINTKFRKHEKNVRFFEANRLSTMQPLLQLKD